MRAIITLDPKSSWGTTAPNPSRVIEGKDIKARFDDAAKSWYVTDDGVTRAIFSQFHVISIEIDQ